MTTREPGAKDVLTEALADGGVAGGGFGGFFEVGDAVEFDDGFGGGAGRDDGDNGSVRLW